MNKKGSIQDLALILTILFFFSIVVLIGFKVSDMFTTEIATMGSDIPTEANTAATQLTNYYPGVMDNMFLFLMVGMSMVALLLASLVRIHPAFIGLFFIALIIIIVIGGAFSNVYQEMSTNAEFSALTDRMTFMDLIMTYLPFFIGVIGITLSIIMYKQWQNA
jgi:hypothetical protein